MFRILDQTGADLGTAQQRFQICVCINVTLFNLGPAANGDDKIVRKPAQIGRCGDQIVMTKTSKCLGIQHAFVDAVQMIDHRHTAPTHAEGGMDVGLCPIHDLAQLVPIGHLFKRQMFDGGTRNDQPVEFFATFCNLIKGAVKACHMLGSGGFGLVIAHPDKRQFDLQRCRPNQAGKLDFRLNFARH